MTPEQNAHVKTLASREEIFDYVESHLKNQGQRSIHPSGPLQVGARCAYRGEGGTMCAVGCLIADDEYYPGMEGRPVAELFGYADGTFDTFQEERAAFPERLIPHRRMLADLQSLHDWASSWSSSGKGLSSQGISLLQDLRQVWLKDSN